MTAHFKNIVSSSALAMAIVAAPASAQVGAPVPAPENTAPSTAASPEPADTSQSASGTAAGAGQSAPLAARGSQDNTGLADIVVTAQKRAQNVQDVPIAISAVLGSTLAKGGVVNTEDLRVAFAGVNIKTTSSQFQPSIRGVGTATSNVENSVALYIDGVYYPNQSDARRELNDIDQVAVLKGPQGTLFGRNATAGVIQITTRAPSHTWSTELNASIDNYATFRTSAYVTGGITPELAFSLSGNYTTQGNGWGKNYTTGRDTFKIYHIGAVRGKLLYEPGSATDITIIGDYTDRRDNIGAYDQAFPGTTINPLVPYVKPPGVHDSYNNDESLNLYKGGGASITANHSLNFAKIQSITAYRQFRTGYQLDADLTRVRGYLLNTTNNKAKSFSQELQLTSNGDGKLNWAVGGFYFHYVNGLKPVYRSYAGPLYVPLPTSFVERDIDSDETVNSVAAFAQADYEFLPRTRLTLGVRGTYEKRSLVGVNSGTRANGQFVPSIITINGASITVHQPTWRVALDHKFDDETLGYISYNRGFKSGGFNISNLANPSYEPERLDAYEAGVKTRVLNSRLQLNFAGFYYSYSNLQVLQLINAAATISNGAKAELYGANLDFEAQLVENLRVTGGLELLHANFTQYSNAIISFSVPTGGIGTRFGDASGNRLPLSQKVTGNIALDYSKEVAFGRIGFNAAVNYNGNYAFDPDNAVKQKAYTNINLSSNLTPQGSTVTLSVFIRNLLDNKVISYSTASSPLGYITTYDNPPRIFGMSARYKF